MKDNNEPKKDRYAIILITLLIGLSIIIPIAINSGFRETLTPLIGSLFICLAVWINFNFSLDDDIKDYEKNNNHLLVNLSNSKKMDHLPFRASFINTSDNKPIFYIRNVDSKKWDQVKIIIEQNQEGKINNKSYSFKIFNNGEEKAITTDFTLHPNDIWKIMVMSNKGYAIDFACLKKKNFIDSLVEEKKKTYIWS